MTAADNGVVVLRAGPTWQAGPPRDLTELATALSGLEQYWRVAVTVASSVQNVTVDSFQKIYSDLGQVIQNVWVMFQNQKCLHELLDQIAPFILNMRRDLEQLNLGLQVQHVQQVLKFSQLEEAWGTKFAEQEKGWTQRFAENEGTLQRTLVELQKIDSFLQRIELQTKGCVPNYTELQSHFQFSQWKADCEGTQKFVREFSELAPRLEEAISKMGAFDSEILRLENAMKSWQETAMQEIQKRDDHLDFLTSQAEEFQRENAELREKMNIIENILVTRAAESAAAQAATAVSTAVTANSLEPAASAAQMGLQPLG